MNIPNEFVPDPQPAKGVRFPETLGFVLRILSTYWRNESILSLSAEVIDNYRLETMLKEKNHGPRI